MHPSHISKKGVVKTRANIFISMTVCLLLRHLTANEKRSKLSRKAARSGQQFKKH